MSNFQSSVFLRRVLLVDGATSAGAGVLMLAGAERLAAPLGLPAGLLSGAGAILLPFAGFVLWLATRKVLPRVPVWAVIALNAIWAIDSVALLLSGWVAPSVWGHIFVAAQALAVAVLAELEYFGLRKSTVAA